MLPVVARNRQPLKKYGSKLESSFKGNGTFWRDIAADWLSKIWIGYHQSFTEVKMSEDWLLIL